MNMQKQKRIWQAFEAPLGLVRSAADWKRLLGSDYEKVRPHLRPKQGLATSVPCPSKPRCGCLHGVIEHKRDDLVSVCRCYPKRCRTTPIDRTDAVVYELHRGGLGTAIASALGIRPEERALRGLRATWQIGSYAPQAGLRLPLYLSIQSDPEDFKLAVNSLAAADPGPFVLLAPTEDFWKPEYHNLLRARKSRFLALAEIMEWNGKPAAKQPIDKLLAGLLEDVLPGAATEYAVRKEGKTWRFVFAGKPISVLDSKGVAYLELLLKNPGQDLRAGDLQAAATGIPSLISDGIGAVHDGGSVSEYQTPVARGRRIPAAERTDRQAINEYRQKIADLEEEMREAEANNDTGRAESLRRDYNALVQEVARSRGLRGRIRHDDDAERARQAVSTALHRVIDPMKKSHPGLWQHLDRSIVNGKKGVYHVNLVDGGLGGDEDFLARGLGSGGMDIAFQRAFHLGP